MLISSPRLVVAETLEEVLRARADRGDAQVVCGGTEVVADRNLGAIDPPGYVSLRRVAELQDVTTDGTVMRIGAGVTIARLLQNPIADAVPLLARTARTMCTRQVRNRATLGGNVASGGPDRSLPPALLALDAKVTLASESGERELALDDFLAPFGTTNLGPDEIVTGVTVPLVRGFADFTQVGPRNAQYFPTAAVALVMDEDARNVRIGLANGADRACRSPEAEEFAGSTIDWAGRTVRDEVAVGFGRLVSEHSDPPGDLTATSDYRRHALGVMATRALRRAFEDMP